MDDELVVSRDLLKAIGADTRIAILKALLERQKTQSELAAELKLSAPTVLAHMEQLGRAGLTEYAPQDRERKWKYIRLTKLGRSLVERKRLNVIVLLSNASAVASAALLLLYLLWPLLSGPAPVQPPSGNGSALMGLGDAGRTLLGALLMIALLMTVLLLILRLWKAPRQGSPGPSL